MAFLPIAQTVPQYEDLNGDPAVGHVLKFFTAGTTTNINLATDNTGGTQVSDVVLNSLGYPEVSGSTIIPHLEEEYKIKLYPTQAAADADTGAVWSIDNITPAGSFNPIADESADTTSFITFVTAATGNLGQKTNSALTFNSVNGDLGVGLLTSAGVISTTDSTISTSGATGSINTAGGIGAVKDIVTDRTVIALGITAAGDLAAFGRSGTFGATITGSGSINDFTWRNKDAALVAGNPTGTTTLVGASGDEIYGQFAIKSSDESVTNSLTLQDDDDLQATLAANSIYQIEVMLSVVSASATPDFKFQFTEPDGTFLLQGFHAESGDATLTSFPRDESSAVLAILLEAAAIEFIHMNILAKPAGTGGIFKLEWAQVTSDATATIVQAGSWMRTTKLA
ncbi:MAG: hypothetical protein O7D95_02885 [Betaproteobacteria bacterium]|nr:hypothetical protein [Betaproteobacteria bacterium]